jgi:hypothetical protein
MSDNRQKTVVNTLGSSNISSKDREELDFYQTPSGAVKALIDSGLLDRSLKVWEPMAGNGAIADVLKENGFKVACSDIVQRRYKLDFVRDFFSVKTQEGKSSAFQIVTNPPYEKANDFLLHSLSLSPAFLAAFLPVRYLEGKQRYIDIYSKYIPSDVIVFARRYGCYKEADLEAGIVTDHGIGSAVAYMWLCFKKQDDGSYGKETKLHFSF